jgi:hypothetical protein
MRNYSRPLKNAAVSGNENTYNSFLPRDTTVRRAYCERKPIRYSGRSLGTFPLDTSSHPQTGIDQLPGLYLCFDFRVGLEKKDCQCGCRTNGQFCVACAQACCGSMFSMASSVKAAELGKAVSDSA